MRRFLLVTAISALCFQIAKATTVTGINAVSKNGQVFVTWTNLTTTGVEYILYKSSSPIVYGYQLSSAQNLGYVHDSSSLNERFTQIIGVHTYFEIDSASTPLLPSQGLFVATSTAKGSFYYAVVTSVAGIADTTITAGVNSLTTPLNETVAGPSAVWQQSYSVGSTTVQVYVQFASSITSPIYPKMTLQGSFPFNVGISIPAQGTDHPLELRLHGGGGNFLEVMGTPFDSNAYGLGVDDWLPNAGDFSTAWFGNFENYDGYSKRNPVPDTGINESVTLHRIIYTIDWAQKKFPIDTARLYISGSSMGASGTMWLASYIPNRIAVVGITVPKFDLSFLNDPDPGYEFHTGYKLRLEIDTLLGKVSTNLLCDLGYGTYDFLNCGYMMHVNSNTSLPVIYAQSGKNDSLTGWAEKIPFYDSVNTNKAGGFYYWDMRGHSGEGKEWNVTPKYLHFASNKSYPAFSDCSINNNPGNGVKTDGDSVGTINGYLDWNDSIVDEPDFWQCTLFVQNAAMVHGSLVAPNSCTATVTLNRVQNYKPQIGDSVAWVNYSATYDTLQYGSFLYTGGRISIPNVEMYKSSNILQVYDPRTLTNRFPLSSLGYSVNLYPNPSPGYAQIAVEVKQPAKDLRVELINLAGQVLRSWYYPTVNNNLNIVYDLYSFSKGEYLIRFTCGMFTTTKKIVLQ